MDVDKYGSLEGGVKVEPLLLKLVVNSAGGFNCKPYLVFY